VRAWCLRSINKNRKRGRLCQRGAATGGKIKDQREKIYKAVGVGGVAGGLHTFNKGGEREVELYSLCHP